MNATCDFHALLSACIEFPTDVSPRLILSDWMMDHDWPDEKAREAIVPPMFSQFLPLSYYGSGRGSGIGICIGIGIGRGIGSGTKEIILEIGKAYMLETVDWFAWVGRVKKQIGPWEYEFESCSKIRDTNNGDVWNELCAGDKNARKTASYSHYKVPVILGLGVVVKVEWVGKTPQEEGLPG